MISWLTNLKRRQKNWITWWECTWLVPLLLQPISAVSNEASTFLPQHHPASELRQGLYPENDANFSLVSLSQLSLSVSCPQEKKKTQGSLSKAVAVFKKQKQCNRERYTHPSFKYNLVSCRWLIKSSKGKIIKPWIPQSRIKTGFSKCNNKAKKFSQDMYDNLKKHLLPTSLMSVFSTNHLAPSVMNPEKLESNSFLNISRLIKNPQEWD